MSGATNIEDAIADTITRCQALGYDARGMSQAIVKVVTDWTAELSIDQDEAREMLGERTVDQDEIARFFVDGYKRDAETMIRKLAAKSKETNRDKP